MRMILFEVAEHINRIAVESDLYGGKRVAALAGHRLQVAGYPATGMRVSDVSEGAGIFLPDFRHSDVAIAAIVGERHLAALCKAQGLILALDECNEQFFRLGSGQAAICALPWQRCGQLHSTFSEDCAVARTHFLEAYFVKRPGFSIGQTRSRRHRPAATRLRRCHRN